MAPSRHLSGLPQAGSALVAVADGGEAVGGFDTAPPRGGFEQSAVVAGVADRFVGIVGFGQQPAAGGGGVEGGGECWIVPVASTR